MFSTLSKNNLSNSPSVPWLINLPLTLQVVTMDDPTGQSKHAAKKGRQGKADDYFK